MAEGINVQLKDYSGNKVNPATTGEQVQLADGSNAEAKFKTLEGAVAGVVPCYVVDDIAARDALENLKRGNLCWVTDATADETVTKGAAQYIYNGSAWVKLTEAESLDLVVQWADIQGKEAVEAAMAQAHSHDNAVLLATISADGETATINGKTFYAGRQVALIEAGGEIPADMSPFGVVFEKMADSPAA